MDNYEVGKTPERKTLAPKEVEIVDVTIEKKEGLKDAIRLWCKHPDNEKLIQIGKIKYLKEGKMTVQGLWLSLDKDGKISSQSAFAKIIKEIKQEEKTDEEEDNAIGGLIKYLLGQ